MKQCRKCSTMKPFDSFYKEAANRDGYANRCKTCKNQQTQVYRDKHRAQYNAEMREWRKNNPQEVKDYDLKRCYGIRLTDYNELLMLQNGKCAVCKKPQNGKRPLVVDHCHTANKVRGLLCYKCNRDMAVVDNKEHLAELILYRDKA